jgi:hypothetical protein
MRFYANYISTSVGGDYYAAMFAEKDTDDQDCYLIIQRQFEDPDDDTRYIETHDANTAVISLYAGSSSRRRRCWSSSTVQATI